MLAASLAGASFAAAVATAALVATNLPTAPEWPTFLEILPLTIVYGAAGALITRQRPNHPIGWLFFLISIDSGLTALADAYAGHHLAGWAAAAWFQTWSLYLSYPVAFSLLLMLFPNGRLPSRRWRPLLGLTLLAAGFRVIVEALTPGPVSGHFSGSMLLLANPSGIVPLAFANGRVGSAIVVATWLLSLAALVGAVAALIVKLALARGEERQQLKWLALVAALIAPAFALHFLIQLAWRGLGLDFGAILFHALLVIGLPLATAVAILRHRLYEVDLVINRTLVYGALTVILVGLYVGVVSGTAAILQGHGNLLVSLIATGLIAVAFAPLRIRIQAAVNRLLYGIERDHYEILADLGRQLETMGTDRPLLDAVAATVARALRLPYAAIRLDADTGSSAAGEFGSLTGEEIHVALVYQGQSTGELVLGAGPSWTGLSSTDRKLLPDLARQAAVAAYSVALALELQRSRERLVSALEEERRRLRRDLHDGLGPALAAQTLKAGSARSLFERDPERAKALLEEIERDAQTAIADVRRLVYDLRPPALDELGLAGAIRQTASAHAGAVRMTVEVPDSLPPLPAAVEVATYRIAQEALTNVSRHAHAHRCRLRLTVDEDLKLEVTDNGVGLGSARPSGVGLTSIRERTAELGGLCKIGPGRGGGTRVFVQLPLAARA